MIIHYCKKTVTEVIIIIIISITISNNKLISFVNSVIFINLYVYWYKFLVMIN
uniref:Uncharacterized protein n=1 Tax=Amphimedon queenslandica TaxID=400682 RepID=A0A1X7VU70_AMPQE